jgi:hypothetical protein
MQMVQFGLQQVLAQMVVIETTAISNMMHPHLEPTNTQ